MPYIERSETELINSAVNWIKKSFREGVAYIALAGHYFPIGKKEEMINQLKNRDTDSLVFKNLVTEIKKFAKTHDLDPLNVLDNKKPNRASC